MKRSEEESRFADNGCARATAYLKVQSHCLSCPFAECLEVEEDGARKSIKLSSVPLRGRLPSTKSLKRIEMIRGLHQQGYKAPAIAIRTGVSKTYIYRVWND